MAKIIAVSSQKGGIGKTTVTVNLAAGLTRKEKKVLLIDLDPQRASSSILTGASLEKNLSHIFNLGQDNLDIKDVIQKTEEFDIISSDYNLTVSERIIERDPMPQLLLKEKLEDVENDYDYILMDCPPSLGMLTINALCISDLIITPIEPNKLAMDGLMELFGAVSKIRKRLNPSVKVHMLISKLDSRRKIAKDYTDGIAQISGKNAGVFETTIRLSTIVEQSQNQSKSIFAFDPTARNQVTKDFLNLTEEVEKFEW